MLAINYDKEQKIFNLSNGKISYILGIEKDCYVKHIYFGNIYHHIMEVMLNYFMIEVFVQIR